MTLEEIRKLNNKEKDTKLNELKKELFNLRFESALGKLENTSKIKQTKKTIARIKTIQKES